METLNPRQLAKEAQTEYQNNRYLSAARLYKAAAEGFLATGDELGAAEQKNNCSVAYLKSGNAQAAWEAVSGTEDIFSQHGDVKGQAMALGNQAAALEKLKRYDEAMQVYERSSELLRNAGESELRAYVLQSISTLQLRKRRYLEAYATMRVAIIGLKKPNFRQRILKTLIQIPYNFLK
jgi:tetratricopeptide (TPR) repeat protein